MVAISEARRVVHDADILDGEPTLEGTRITVRAIVLALDEMHHDLKCVLRMFPPLRTVDIKGAMRYYESHRGEIDGYIAENDLEDAVIEECPDLRCPPPQSI